MPYIASIGTYLPCWGTPDTRVAGDDEDAITLAVEAGRAALTSGGPVQYVVVVSRDLPLTESSNAAVLLAGLGLDPELEVIERLGGAPATLDALGSARPRTLVIGVDLEAAGAAAALTADRGMGVRTAARVSRSLPVRTRNASGDVHDYGDPRLLRKRGYLASLASAWVDTPVVVAGLDHRQAAALTAGAPTAAQSVRLPTSGASSALFALAVMAESGMTGPLVGVEQASLSGLTVGGEDSAQVHRREAAARPAPEATYVADGEIPISLAAYERAFEAKVRWEAGKYSDSDKLDFPPRYRVNSDGTLNTDYTLVELPRTGTVYTETTVHVPVPGLATPYSLVLVELDGVGIRALVRVTGAEAGTVGIGDRGRMVLRRVAVRSGVPDYGYAFEPDPPGLDAVTETETEDAA
ncbi:OB-fold domain-containing protein [Rhodococcus chondri]|uniref:OB-fold domain-containing protein n=1 Tax=Rhodococcus chondri TaxID=3065941 RepID=A0ABU7JKV4_9NOCA|nr:OB-fold domain-containing protein [Rhodococcus sp. CC-R104]MEE2030676.1 OB-fold domain-containing protein [Rhodococcus sp. CC-R104]